MKMLGSNEFYRTYCSTTGTLNDGLLEYGTTSKPQRTATGTRGGLRDEIDRLLASNEKDKEY